MATDPRSGFPGCPGTPAAGTGRTGSWWAGGIVAALLAVPLPWFGWPGAVVTVAFAAFAYRLGAVDARGAVAGCAIALTLFWFAGPGAFVALVAVFVLTWISTRLGYARKQRLGKAENRRGRSAGQVLANLAVAAGCAVAIGLLHTEAASLALAAALAEAAADTVSSECGVAWSDRVRLITNWQRVPAGTNGGISLPGTAAGTVAAALVASVCTGPNLAAPAAIPLATAAAVLGMLFDSVLGATLEHRGIMGNNAVNFLGTLFAAAVAFLAASF